MYIQHRTQDTEQAQEKQKAQHRKLTTLAEQHKNKNKNKLANKWGWTQVLAKGKQVHASYKTP